MLRCKCDLHVKHVSHASWVLRSPPVREVFSSVVCFSPRQVQLQLTEEGWARRSEKTVLQALVRLADMHETLTAAAAAAT